MNNVLKGVNCQRCGWGGVESELDNWELCPECGRNCTGEADVFECKKCKSECQEVWHATFKDYSCEECGTIYNSGGQEIANPYGEFNEALYDDDY